MCPLGLDSGILRRITEEAAIEAAFLFGAAHPEDIHSLLPQCLLPLADTCLTPKRCWPSRILFDLAYFNVRFPLTDRATSYPTRYLGSCCGHAAIISRMSNRVALNMDFDRKVVVETNRQDWVPSPSPGVWRKPLAREEAERGHTTSMVRFDPGSYFSRHEHPLGEEILVLEGSLSDEHGDYGPGTYFRNPPGSGHSPFSKDGCTLFVKLDQLSPDDTTPVRIDTRRTPWLQGQGRLQVMPLHDFRGEHVALVKWPAGERFQPHRHFGGEEILVLSGEFRDEFGRYPAGTWLRSPHMSQHNPYVDEQTVIWVKVGHLPV